MELFGSVPLNVPPGDSRSEQLERVYSLTRPGWSKCVAGKRKMVTGRHWEG
jgi:hypothetical protein